MKTKEQFLETLRHFNLTKTTEEPIVGYSVFNTSSKYKCCIYFYNNNKRVRLTINLDSTTKKKAETEALEFKLRCQEALHFCFISQSKHPLLESMRKWVDALGSTNSVEQTTLVTMYNKLQVVERYKPFETISVEDFKQSDINRFTQWALDKGSKSGSSLARETVRGIHTFLSMFFNFAYNQGIIDRNTCNNTIVPKRVTDNNNTEGKQWLDIDEYKAFRNWLVVQVEQGRTAYKKLIDIVDIEIYTGMRREELMGLKWDCIDFDNGLMSTGGARVRAGSKDVYKTTLKNSSSHRIYRLTDKILKILSDLHSVHIEAGIYKPDGFIFVYTDGAKKGKPYGLDATSKLFRKAILECDCIDDKSLTFHNLRHSCCSIMFKLGYDKAEVQAWLGHKEGSAITDRVYNHYKHILHSDRLDKLNDIIGA